MARPDKSETKDHQAFKRSLDKQNRLETVGGDAAKRARDLAEGEAAHQGIPALERSSKGRPKQR